MATAEHQSSLDAIVIPACSRCSFRKIRCDRKAPKCSACDKARCACLLEDRSRGQSYSRQYAEDLIDEIRRLEALDGIRGVAVADTDEVAAENVRSPFATSSVPDSHYARTDQATIGQRFVGESSFLQYMFGDGYWSAIQNKLGHIFAHSRPILKQPDSRHDWPSLETGYLLITNFLGTNYLNHPFLEPEGLLRTFHDVYRMGPQKASPRDCYMLFMVFALSSVRTFRDGRTSSHPYGYFISAQQYLHDTPMIGSIESIQNLLILARFGMYHDINTSLWELSHICIRQCIELDLHRQLPNSESLVVQQLRRCVFWDCYLNERYISDTLGRPYAIIDEVIETPLPMHVSYDDLRANPLANSHSEHAVVNNSDKPNEMSVFLSMIGLRRIQSANRAAISEVHEISNATSRNPVWKAPGLVMYKVQESLLQLDKWLADSPKFPSPTAPYHYPSWYSFLVVKEKLNVARAALTCLSQLNTRPPQELFGYCSTSAIEVIRLFRQLFDSKSLLPTRSYFQTIFVCGLTLMFCESGLARSAQTSQETLRRSRSEVTAALRSCTRVLHQVSKEMPESQLYYIVFEALRRKVEPDITADVRQSPPQVAADTAVKRPPQNISSSPTAQVPATTADQDPVAPGQDMMDTNLSLVENSSVGTFDDDELFANLDNIAKDDWNWEAFLSEGNMQQMVTDVGNYAWDQPSSGYWF